MIIRDAGFSVPFFMPSFDCVICFLPQGAQRMHKVHKENSALSESLVALVVKQGVF